MIINNIDVDGVSELVRSPVQDDRGLFERHYCHDLLRANQSSRSITQINHSLT